MNSTNSYFESSVNSPQDILTLTKAFSKDQYVYQQGDSAAKYFKVIEGVVVLGSYSLDGKMIFKGLIHEGEFFGDEVASGQEERLNFAMALSKELVVEEYKHSDFWSNSDHQKQVLYSSLKRNNNIQKVMEVNTSFSVEQRVKNFLKDLAQIKGIKLLTGEVMVRMHVKHRELAFICNSSRQCISAIVSKFQKDGLVKMDRSSFILNSNF